MKNATVSILILSKFKRRFRCLARRFFAKSLLPFFDIFICNLISAFNLRFVLHFWFATWSAFKFAVCFFFFKNERI